MVGRVFCATRKASVLGRRKNNFKYGRRSNGSRLHKYPCKMELPRAGGIGKRPKGEGDSVCETLEEKQSTRRDRIRCTYQSTRQSRQVWLKSKRCLRFRLCDARGRRGAVVWLVDLNADARSDLSPKAERGKQERRRLLSRLNWTRVTVVELRTNGGWEQRTRE